MASRIESQGEPAQLTSCPCCGSVLAIPDEGLESGTHTIHYPVASASPSQPTSASVAPPSGSATLQSARLTSHSNTTHTLSVKLEVPAGTTFQPARIDEWWIVWIGIVHQHTPTHRLDQFPELVAAAPKGLFMVGPPALELDGDSGTGQQPLCFVDQTTHDMRIGWYTDTYRRTADGWRLRTRSMTFLRRSGTRDAGRPHDPSRPVPVAQVARRS